MTKHHNFVLQPGYVESTTLAEMSVSHDEGFDTIPEALTHFRDTLKSYTEANVKSSRKCCVASMKNKKARYCDQCGYQLKRTVTPAENADYFQKMMIMSIDTASDVGVYDHFEAAGWHLGHFLHGISTSCYIQGFYRWLEEEGAWCEGTYPDGTLWNNRDSH